MLGATPSRRATSATVMSSSSNMAFAAFKSFAESFFGRPLVRPLARADSKPATVRCPEDEAAELP